jgi:hypothetical protein
MKRCLKCEGFVPPGAMCCPNCNSTKGAWWAAPLAFAGAGLATVTLSACYGPACAVQVTLPDGGSDLRYSGGQVCGSTYDCRAPLADGGDVQLDPEWKDLCTEPSWPDAGETDGGSDGGP